MNEGMRDQRGECRHAGQIQSVQVRKLKEARECKGRAERSGSAQVSRDNHFYGIAYAIPAGGKKCMQ